MFGMMNNNLTQELKNLGLNDKEAQVYLVLLTKGPQTPLELSRNTKLNRTTIYRLMENMKEVGFVEEILDQKSTKFEASSPSKLGMLLTRKEMELEGLKTNYSKLISDLSVIEHNPASSTKVIYFRSKSGLQQLLWNTLKAGKSENVGYGYLNWNESVGKPFAEKLRQECVNRKLYAREILNTIDRDRGFTQVTHYFDFYQNRYLPPKILEIKHDTYIYNDVFAFYHFLQNELFGIEIHNAEIAKTQRQIFEILWKMAKK
jgi:sugar-specific transcriptional regulator TrmB